MRDTEGIFIPKRVANSVFLLADLNSLQRTPNSGCSEALQLSLLGAWNRQHGTVLHSDSGFSNLKRMAFPEDGGPVTDNDFFCSQLATQNL